MQFWGGWKLLGGQLRKGLKELTERATAFVKEAGVAFQDVPEVGLVLIKRRMERMRKVRSQGGRDCTATRRVCRERSGDGRALAAPSQKGELLKGFYKEEEGYHLT